MIVGLHWGTRGTEEKIETAHSSALRAFGGECCNTSILLNMSPKIEGV